MLHAEEEKKKSFDSQETLPFGTNHRSTEWPYTGWLCFVEPI
jgi:hypothetical protein